MTDAPHTIYAAPSPDKGWADGFCGDWPSPLNPHDTRYRRADLPPTLEQALQVPEVRELVEACKGLGLRELVAGWNGEGRDKPYEPHPPHLWAKITTTTGAVYAIDAALRAWEWGEG